MFGLWVRLNSQLFGSAARKYTQSRPTAPQSTDDTRVLHLHSRARESFQLHTESASSSALLCQSVSPGRQLATQGEPGATDHCDIMKDNSEANGCTRTLRLEEGGVSFDDTFSVPDSQDEAAAAVVPIQPVVSPDGIAISCSRTEKPPRSSACKNILLGQALSVLIATMSMSSASLSDRGVNLPCFVNFLNYGMITVFFFLPKLLAGGSLQLSVPWWRYALYALVRTKEGPPPCARV